MGEQAPSLRLGVWGGGNLGARLWRWAPGGLGGHAVSGPEGLSMKGWAEREGRSPGKL